MNAERAPATAAPPGDNGPAARLDAYRDRIDQVLKDAIPAGDQAPAQLHQAMRYAVTAGGKRVRPLLVYAAGEALGADLDALAQLDSIACALELIHAYSLVHDDLPAMDDDDLRRGRPSCHRAFDEATAILAGDALQALAFERLALDTGVTAAALILALARACGSQGMAGGQALDLAAVGHTMDRAALEHMHALKTGALIRSATSMPAIALGASELQRGALDCYGAALGLAFQVKDDILDVEGETDVIGKPQGSDVARNKPTFPSLIGMNESKALAESLHQTARAALDQLPGDVTALTYLAEFIVNRRY